MARRTRLRRFGKRSRDAHARPLRFEPLEDRRVLSITVDTLLDVVDANDGLTSLREAITTANSHAGADTIDFAPSLTANGPATILLTQKQLTITDSLTVVGPTVNQLTIDASGSDPTPGVIKQDGSAAFVVKVPFNGGVNLEFDNLRITGADYNYAGGAIDAEPTSNVVLRNMLIDHNGGWGNGGGVYVQGSLTVTDSTFSDNSVFGNGGAMSVKGNLNITNSLVTRNTASNISGGVDNWSGLFSADHLVVTNNTAQSGGGMQLADRQVQIKNSTISGNRAVNSLNGGGGLWTHYGWAESSNSITSTTISDNVVYFDPRATSQSGGGGMLDDTGRLLNLTGCTITGNRVVGSTTADGGGINFNVGALLSVYSSQIANNQTTGRGGGIAAPRGNITLKSSTVSGNSAFAGGGGLFAYDYINGTDTTVADNSTSGTHALGGGANATTITLTNCTFSGNKTTGAMSTGGGIYVRSQLTMTSCTISGNETRGPSSDGGGIFVRTGFNLNFSTVVNNAAVDPTSSYGGIRGGAVGTNDIVAGNTAGASIPDTTAMLAHSIIGDNAGTILVESQTPNFNGTRIGSSTGGGVIDPHLGPLTYNGGPTQTHTPLPGSVAINAGDPVAKAGVGITPQYDQRESPFGRVVGGRIDIGAVESQPNPLPGDFNFNHRVDASDYIIWRMTMGSSTDLRADGDANGIVDQADYDFWRAHFGQTLPGSGAATSVIAGSDAEAELSPSGPQNNGLKVKVLIGLPLAASVDAERGDDMPIVTASHGVAQEISVSASDEALLAWLDSFVQAPKKTTISDGVDASKAISITSTETAAPSLKASLCKSVAVQLHSTT